MENPVRRIHAEAVVQDVGSVLRTDDHSLQVAVGGVAHEAKRAVSCLLEPEPGDMVLVSFIPGKCCYVIAVLERESLARARLVHAGDLELQLPTGRLSVAASRGMSVVSGVDVSLVTQAVKAHAAKADFCIEGLQFLGSLARVEIGSLKLVGRFFDSVLERFSQRVQRSYRKVEGLDQVRAEQMDYVADKNVSVRGRNALLTADQLVKLDGDQVHLG